MQTLCLFAPLVSSLPIDIKFERSVSLKRVTKYLGEDNHLHGFYQTDSQLADY